MAEWSDLPIEVLHMVIKRSTQNTRNALRTCSYGNQNAVESSRLKSIKYLSIYFRGQKWAIYTEDTCGSYKVIESENFENWQMELINVLESIDCIKDFSIRDFNSDNPVKLIKDKDQKRIRVERFICYVENGVQLEGILSQIEPIYLRKVEAWTDGGNSNIYNMPQIIHAEEVSVVERTSINEHQLLGLNARYVSFSEPSFCLRNYVKKCTSVASTILPHFQFFCVNPFLDFCNIYSTLSKKQIILDTDKSTIKLKLIFDRVDSSNLLRFHVEGSLFFTSERVSSRILRIHQSALRRFEMLKVSFCDRDKKWKIVAVRKFQSPKYFSAVSVGKAQKILNYLLQNTDCIHMFDIGLSSEMKLKPRKTKLVVNKLDVCARTHKEICRLLQHIEPVYLNELIIITQDKIELDKFNLPHIYHLETFRITSEIRSSSKGWVKRTIRWDHDEGTFNYTDGKKDDNHFEGNKDKFSTECFINQYIKHILPKLNKKPYFFKFSEDRGDERKEDSIMNLLKTLDGVDVIGSERSDCDRFIFIDIDTPFLEYVLKLQYCGNELFGRRSGREHVVNDGYSFLFNYLTKPGRTSQISNPALVTPF